MSPAGPEPGRAHRPPPKADEQLRTAPAAEHPPVAEADEQRRVAAADEPPAVASADKQPAVTEAGGRPAVAGGDEQALAATRGEQAADKQSVVSGADERLRVAVGDEQLWAAVADPSRRRILDLLLVRGEATPTALAAEVSFTRQAVSKHLAVLAQAGLVEAHRIGRETRYVVCAERLEAAAAAMGHAAAQWDRRLRAIKRLAETAATATAAEAARELQRPDNQGDSHE